jgi:2-keto-4-pentenoate hydratase
MTPAAILRHLDTGQCWPATEAQAVGGDVAAAYQQALAVRALRLARGEHSRGYKIGFTNRTLWARYAVAAPIWGTVWDTTLVACEGQGVLSLANTCQPRIEPEIVFALRATPPSHASLEQLFACVDWLAPGFEVVQSHLPEWKFNAAQTVADGGLHARLLVGAPLPVRELAATGHALDATLAQARVGLQCNGALVEAGAGHQVLDGPLHALLHFVHEHQACPGAPALQAGDVVTTGTWTDAWPVTPGQVWQANWDVPTLTLEVAFR